MIEERLGEMLTVRGMTLAVAESCTGGLLASRITDIPGSSVYFRGGVIAYQNDVKERLLAVPASILSRHGAVSAETAKAMATGCKDLLASDIAVAITGIAGPGGGSAERPVGLVYIAVATAEGVRCQRFVWDGDRLANKEQSADAAFKLVLDRLEDTPSLFESGEEIR
ncbi:CinA family protein [Candidatus Bipolaricaulota bacterium]|jgi:PncC family amidohydrolase|nr:CinA family protein [Candidatus Bipolaricaulota bacterium]